MSNRHPPRVILKVLYRRFLNTHRFGDFGSIHESCKLQSVFFFQRQSQPLPSLGNLLQCLLRMLIDAGYTECLCQAPWDDFLSDLGPVPAALSRQMLPGDCDQPGFLFPRGHEKYGGLIYSLPSAACGSSKRFSHHP